MPAIVATVPVITPVIMMVMIAAMVVTPPFANRYGDIVDVSRRLAVTMMSNGPWLVIHHAWRLAVIAAMAVVAPIVERRPQQHADCNTRYDGDDEFLSLKGGSAAGHC